MRQRRRQQLSDEAADYLRDSIIAGELPVGTFIRAESIADSLDISITPVREALLILRGEGFLRLEPRRGFAVAELSSNDVRDVFWVQSILAGELAARSARRISAEHIEQLREIQDEINDGLKEEDANRVDAANYEFHRLVNLCADSPKVAWFIGTAAKYVPRSFFGTIEGWPAASVHDHSAILRAMERGDEEEAREAMSLHIRHAGDLLVAHRSRERS